MIVRHRRHIETRTWKVFCEALGLDAVRTLAGDFEDIRYPGDREAWRVIRSVTARPRWSLARTWRQKELRRLILRLIAAETIRIQVAPVEDLMPALRRALWRARWLVASARARILWRRAWQRR
jgi:hypothetical protein